MLGYGATHPKTKGYLRSQVLEIYSLVPYGIEGQGYKAAQTGFATVDSPTGPYIFVWAMYGPDKLSFGNMGVYQQGDLPEKGRVESLEGLRILNDNI